MLAAAPCLCGFAASLVSRACVPCCACYVPPALVALLLAATAGGARAGGGSRPRDVRFASCASVLFLGLRSPLARSCSRCLRLAAVCAARGSGAAPVGRFRPRPSSAPRFPRVLLGSAPPPLSVGVFPRCGCPRFSPAVSGER